ncbi:unnamed protein product [Notodromas monacha]|uniref:ditrans,polycis-polyprenyl diphosphate synthase [(2E,6E)-farnesyldiphosphate specific] n=1 Tax=Notodromas monacha TaxID=399045 RepID=A0A7R9BRW7_9CRUS|nr:unnamed protein product [Notodromas monacha]CAG0920551.1 unnamed protein product [Notodromas monacha]
MSASILAAVSTLLLAVLRLCALALVWLRRLRLRIQRITVDGRTAAIEDLRRCDVNRVPKHLVLCVQDTSTLDVLCACVVWCLVAGIGCVTLYDPEGLLKRRKDFLAKTILLEQEKLLGKSYPRFRIKSCDVDFDYGYTNGMVVERVMRLSLSGAQDGKESLVVALRELAKAAMQDALMSSRDLISRIVCKTGFSEPDAMLVVGPVMSTAGFSPWDVRLTEIFQIPSAAELTSRSFVDVLEDFSRCQQRFGT